MMKGLFIGFAVFVFSFFVAAGMIHAQTTTPTSSPTPTPTSSSNSSTPGAPNTGFGY